MESASRLSYSSSLMLRLACSCIKPYTVVTTSRIMHAFCAVIIGRTAGCVQVVLTLAKICPPKRGRSCWSFCHSAKAHGVWDFLCSEKEAWESAPGGVSTSGESAPGPPTVDSVQLWGETELNRQFLRPKKFENCHFNYSQQTVLCIMCLSQTSETTKG